MYILIALKRCLRTVYFPVLLCVLALVLCIMPRIGREEKIPPAGVCDLDGSATTEQIIAMLSENGFVLYPDEDSLRADVTSGVLDCGAIFPCGFSAMVEENRVDGVVTFLTAPLSHAPGMYRNHLTAAVFAQIAPIISAEAFDASGVSKEDVTAKYREIAEGGLMFTFRVESASGEAPSSEMGARSYTMGAAALLIFAMMMHSICHILQYDVKPLGMHLGRGRTVLSAVLPALSVRVAGICLAVLAATVVSGDGILSELLPALVLYTLLLGTGSLLVLSFAPLGGTDGGKLRILTFFVLLAALVLCPILYDAALLFPWVWVLRLLCPPYWLWLFV